MNRTRYFLLSYAHAPAVPDPTDGDPDHWVTTFFNDLNSRIARYAAPDSDIDEGWYDKRIPLGVNWKEAFTEALETAQVFVPLYSPGYFARGRSGREWEGYYQRMLRIDRSDPLARFFPVLWSPLRGNNEPPGMFRARALGKGLPEYEEFGLQGLLRLRRYRDIYDEVVDRLARQIVTRAESAPLPRSPAGDLDQVASRFKADDESLPFGIIVAAPTRDALPPDAPTESYGKDGSQWRPFLTESRPLAFYAAERVEQLDFSASVSSLGAVPQVPTHQPGVVIIDPWFVSSDDGAEALTTLLTGLDEWVLPILVDAGPGNPHKAEFTARARDIVRSTGSLGTEPAQAAAKGITSLNDFVSLMPRLVAEAERRYLRYSSEPRPRQPRLRLGGDIPAGQTGVRRQIDE